MTSGVERLAAALAGRYVIVRELGAGGMATVYLADDLRHARKVAVKVLRPELAAVIGAERFLAEIRTTANLQHPHILPLHDSGEADSFLYYVMPFVEGESLRDRLTREKQLPVRDAVRITSEVAGALDYAHRHGVIHRDIKPENILLHDGRALVADFGIALAASAAGTRMTETGMSLGTPMYMSPEQAMGERVLGPATDVYSLGCVLYEMLVGDPPFIGSTAQAIVAKVMTEKPAPPSRMRDTIPAHVEDAALTALEKLPADRFASAAELAAALSGTGTMEPRTISRRAEPVTAPRNLWRMVSAALGMVVVGLSVLAAWALGRPPASDAPAVYDSALPVGAEIGFTAAAASTAYGIPLRNMSVASSGDFVVYSTAWGDSSGLWYRSLRDTVARAIPGTAGATAPRVSPDGTQIAFFDGGRVMVVPTAGGTRSEVRNGQSAHSLQWTSPTSLLLIDFDGIRLSWIDPQAGQPRASTIPRCSFGHWIPEARQLICSMNGIAIVLDPESGTAWTVRSESRNGTEGDAISGTGFRVVEGAYLIYISPEGVLRGAPYDRERHVVGRSVPLLAGVRREAIGEGQLDLTADGTLVFAPGADATIGPIVRLAPGDPPRQLPVERAPFQRFDLSPDRRWLAAVVLTSEGQDLRIYDLRNNQSFTWLSAEYIRHPLWSPDGERLIFGVRQGASWTVLSGSPGPGTAPDTLYVADSSGSFDPVDYRLDSLGVAQDWGRFTAARFDPRVPVLRFDTVLTDVRFPSLSPDARHLSYTEETGHVIVTRASGNGRRWQVAAEGAEPLWFSPSELLYRSGVEWYLVGIDPATGEPRGAGTLWARDPRFSDTSGWSNRPSRDGGIIYLQGPAQVSGSFFRVIPNWVAQMKAAVDAVNR